MFFILLDEFQRYADMSMVLKNIVDHHPNIKIYVSGSSSLAISTRIQESLAGRKRIVPIYPLTFREFLHFKYRDDLIDQMDRLGALQSDRCPQLVPELYDKLRDFLLFGGYPEVALAGSVEEKRQILTSIFDLYVRKELVDYLQIQKIRHVKTMIQSLAVNHGQAVKYNQLGQIAGLDDKTLKNYLEILKETYLILVQPPWFRNKNLEIVKMPKIYFLDNGVRNYFINNFNPPEQRDDTPFLFEGFVLTELLKNGEPASSLKYWRTKNREEVDVILDHGPQVIPIEVKYKQRLSSSDFRGLRAFKKKYPHAGRPYLINLASNISQREVSLLLPFSLLPENMRGGSNDH
ncbi:MAG: ATP-binding protein [Pseudomonadota bacterium]